MLELGERFVGRDPLTFALLALALTACDGAATDGSGGSSATSATAGQTAAHTTSATSTKASVNASSTSSGTPFVCDPPAEPGSLYEKAATQLMEFDATSMCEYRGKVLLIFDEAAA